MDNEKEQFSNVFFQAIQADISRYRDREWLLAGLFVSTSLVSIEFCFRYQESIMKFLFVFILLQLALAIANCYYLFYTHERLVEVKNVRRNMYFNLYKKKIIDSDFPFLDMELHLIPKGELKKRNFFDSGYKTHVLPFIIFEFFVAFYGIWVACRFALESSIITYLLNIKFLLFLILQLIPNFVLLNKFLILIRLICVLLLF